MTTSRPAAIAASATARMSRDVRRERGDDDARRRIRDELAQDLRDVAFRRALAFADDVRRIADEGEHALLAKLAKARFIGRQTDTGRIVVLPIAAMDGEPGLRADRQRAALRNGMRNGDEFDAERSKLDSIALRDNVDLHLRRIGLGETPRSEQTRRERRRVKRAARAAATAPRSRRHDPRAHA